MRCAGVRRRCWGETLPSCLRSPHPPPLKHGAVSRVSRCQHRFVAYFSLSLYFLGKTVNFLESVFGNSSLARLENVGCSGSLSCFPQGSLQRWMPLKHVCAVLHHSLSSYRVLLTISLALQKFSDFGEKPVFLYRNDHFINLAYVLGLHFSKFWRIRWFFTWLPITLFTFLIE